jgi:hypothetical protein
MPYYRLYLQNGWGHVTKADELFAPDDEAALAAARALRHFHPIEVWQQGRNVGLIEPRPGTPLSGGCYSGA